MPLTGIYRISVPRNDTFALTIEWDGGSAQVLASAIEGRSEAEMNTMLRAGLGFEDAWVHRNDDGTIAVALGQEPAVWPEDKVYP
jgi:hypothetical protein